VVRMISPVVRSPGEDLHRGRLQGDVATALLVRRGPLPAIPALGSNKPVAESARGVIWKRPMSWRELSNIWARSIAAQASDSTRPTSCRSA
jgi:hypothetical protein